MIFITDVEQTVEIDISEKVFEEVLSDEWRSKFYNLQSRQEVADHLAYNYVVNKWKYDRLDGFVHFDDDDIQYLGAW